MVSHKFIDEAPEAVEVPVKVRTMFRAVNKVANACAAAPNVDDKKIKSPIFRICRGLLQGDITSPLYFILALEIILRKHDSRSDKDISLAQTILHTLGYADDVVLLEEGKN